MDERQMNGLLKEQYKILEKDEQRVRRQFKAIRMAHSQKLKPMIIELYYECLDDKGNVDYSQMFKTIPKQEAVELRHEVEKVKRHTNIVAYPFTITKFDQLNKLDACSIKMITNAITEANELYDLYYSFLFTYASSYAKVLTNDILTAYNNRRRGMQNTSDLKDKDINTIINDVENPILDSFQNSHFNTAKQASKTLQQFIMRGEAVGDAITSVLDYVERRNKNTDDRLMYTEDTRTTIGVAEYVARDYVEAFKTVCIHDGKACEVCKDIEAEQEIKPVPISNFIVGVTAPPFHPWCRCGVEFVWKNGDNDDD